MIHTVFRPLHPLNYPSLNTILKEKPIVIWEERNEKK